MAITLVTIMLSITNILCAQHFPFDLGKAISTNGNSRAKGLDFKFNLPVPFVEERGTDPNTVYRFIRYESHQNKGEILIQVFNYDQYPEAKDIRYAFEETFGYLHSENSSFEKVQVAGELGWMFTEHQSAFLNGQLLSYECCMLNVFLHQHLFVVSFMLPSGYDTSITEQDERKMKEFANSIEFY